MTRSRSRCATLRFLASSTTLTRVALMATWGVASAAHAEAVLPVGGTVVSGAAQVGTSGTTTTVMQTSAKAVVNWQSFDVGAGHGVVFAQPDARSATLNRVTGDATSTIAGSITSNGAVYLVNPNGIAITSSGTVRTGGGFVASTLDIANDDFNAGRLNFTGSGASKGVSNAGRIAAGSGAYVALLGGSVSNSGTITVPLGKVGLGAGEGIALDLNGDGFMQVAVPTSAGGIDMSGSIAGARVELRAATVRDAIRNIVNVPGSISADSATGDAGGIVLIASGGTLNASGTLSARATGATGNGGTVETSGDHVNFAGLAVDTSSTGGTTGTWLVDPTDLTVDAVAATTIQNNLATSNVTLQTTATTASGPGTQSAGNGDITIAAPVAWTSTNTLSLLAYNNIALNAGVTGTAGGLTLTAGNGVANTGAISATGAVSVGTFNLTSGIWNQNSAALPAFSATDFRFNPANASFLRVIGGTGAAATPYQIADVYGLQGIASSTLLNSSLALANSIDAASTANWNAGAGFVPIGTDGQGIVLNQFGFRGTFNGRGQVIDGLTIARPFANDVALFGYNAGPISNVALTRVNVVGLGYVGGLTGYSLSTIAGSYVTGTVLGYGDNVGGLAGGFGTISSSYSTADVIGRQYVGGLVGYSGVVTNSYASGKVTGTGAGVGGLAGVATGNITSVYATGTVISSGPFWTGGLVGYLQGVSLNNSFASGQVSGNSLVGGLVGSSSGSVINSYWDNFSTGQGAGIGASSGYTNNVNAVTSDPAQLGGGNYAFKTSAYANFTAASGIGTATPSGFVFMPGNSTRPFLAFEVPTAALVATDSAGRLVLTNSHQLQLIGYDATRLAGSYTLAANLELAETRAVSAGAPGSFAGMWSSSGFVPLGTDGAGNVWDGSAFTSGSTTGFSGLLDGNNYALRNLTITRPSASYAGLFGFSSGTLRNFAVSGTVTGAAYTGGVVGVFTGAASHLLSAVAVTGTTGGTGGLIGLLLSGTINGSSGSGSISGTENVGGLVGEARNSVAAIIDSFASGSVRNSYGTSVGGLVGFLNNGSQVRTSYATGDVYGDKAGGLVGYSLGQISASYATGPVTGGFWAGGLVGFNFGPIDQSYATGAVIGTAGTGYVGGLAGLSGGSISRSYATGSATTAGSSGYAGGLVGRLASSVITQSYASGRVATTAGSFNLGGVVGTADGGGSGVGSSVYWDRFSTGRSAANGDGISSSATAVTSDPSQSATSNYGYRASAYGNFTASDWVFFNGQTRPFGSWELPTSGGAVTNSHQLQLIGYDATRLAGSYTLAGNINLAETGAVAAGTPGSYAGMWAGTGFVPIGTDGTGKVFNTGTGAFDANGIKGFSGTLNGGGYTVSNLTVGRSGTLNVGLFGWTTGTLSNLAMTGASVTGGNNVGALTGYLYSASSSVSGVTIGGTTSGTSNVGGIVGLQYQAGVTGSRSSGAVSGFSNIGGVTGLEQSSTITGTNSSASATASNAYAGGLVGYQLNGTANSNVSGGGNVSAPNGAGGLSGIVVGFANAADASTTATITNASATGNVSGADGTGGLVGFLGYNASVSQAYASGAINGTSNVGGLIGYHYSSSVADSYASGAVAGTTNVGGLVGVADSATVVRTYATGAVGGTTNIGGLIGSAINGASTTASVWDTQTSGRATSAGGTGYTTAQLQDYTNYPSIYPRWDFNSIWQSPNQAGQNGVATPHYPRLRARPTS